MRIRERLVKFRWIAVLGVAAIIVVLTSLQIVEQRRYEATRVKATEVGLAELPSSRRAMAEKLKLSFLPDGYPGKMVKGSVAPHPIYGAYILNDYIGLYRRTGDTKYLDSARTVADASLRRMQPFEDGLVFWYDSDSGIDRHHRHRYYSGLTQSRYLIAFGRLYRATNESRYLTAAQQVLASLAIPVSRGGVLREYEHGIVLEEVPDKPASLVLNGWTTALQNLVAYDELIDSPEARRLIDRSIPLLVSLLPLYDMPELANSRYQLRGRVRLRLAFAPQGAVNIRQASVDIPGQERYLIPMQPRDPGNKFSSSFLEAGLEVHGDQLRVTAQDVTVQVLISMLSHPDPNRINLVIDSPSPATVTVFVQTLDYHPRGRSKASETWRELTQLSLQPGTNNLAVALPWEDVWLAAYPTKFSRLVDGRYNVYHYIHINSLRKLHDYTGHPVLAEFADRWEGYTRRWPEMEIYAGHELSFTPYRYNPSKSKQ